MIPQTNLQYDRELNEQENQKLVNKLKKSENFQRIAKAMHSDSKQAKVRSGHKVHYELEGDNTNLKLLLVELESEKIVYYQESTSAERIQEDMYGAKGDKSKNQAVIFRINEGDVVETTGAYSERLSKDFLSAELRSEDEVSTSAWYDGCYPGFNYCGADCGTRGSSGGGVPQGPYDQCCLEHDNCWANFGTNDCGCDCRLKSCAAANVLHAPVALHTILMSWFPREEGCTC
ncbi:hypothetical protein AAV35_000460 [Salimicrobium jeotgali]|uniref:Phospholipase A2 domain-containing protein n=1 Tax=Salimicrobium jeotgali TaxID=1230341 RepID=K2G6S0_9BACI|nr:hypothetical protein [Salimicrobium jeotgali]AKG03402.1 hypothetical protein AAV35_000460 [Salimicrobium jeotgali]EKE30888.1 hypothetical protein MJ3_11325 [Salimicrobium jeotgali]MBM7697647.1 hypothetical protein [Salimicrobium jeotgali]